MPEALATLDGELAARVEELGHELTRDPADPGLWFRLGMLYEANDLHALAASAYEGSLARRPDDPGAWFRLGVVREHLGDLNGAIAAMRRVLELAPDDVPACLRLAFWHLEAGEVDAAEEAAAAARRLDPTGDGTVLATVRVRLARGEAAAAIELLEASGVLTGRHESHARHLLATAVRRTGRVDDAVALAAAAGPTRLTLPDPAAEELAALRVAWSARIADAAALVRQGDYEAARRILDALVQRGLDDQRVYNMLAQCHVGAGRFAEALEALAKAAAVAPNHFGTRLNFAKVLLLAPPQGASLGTALTHIDTALAIRPEAGEAHLVRGAILLALDRPGEAVDAYLEGWRLDARQDEPLVRAGAFLVAAGDWPQAARLFDALLAADPGHSAAWLGRARCAMEMGDWEGARDALDRLGSLGTSPATLAAARARLGALSGTGG